MPAFLSAFPTLAIDLSSPRAGLGDVRLDRPECIQATVARAAALGVDLCILDDGLDTRPQGARPLGHEPVTLAAFLAVGVPRIGFAITAAPAAFEPYNLARLLASADHVSGGRAAWQLSLDDGARQAGLQPATSADGRDARRASEAAALLRALWESWEADAFLRDKASGAFIDTDKVHYVDHAGPHYAVRGPLNVARPPQGHLPVIGRVDALLAGVAPAAFDVLRGSAAGPDAWARLRGAVSARAPGWRGRLWSDVTVVAGAASASLPAGAAGTGLVLAGDAQALRRQLADWVSTARPDGLVLRFAGGLAGAAAGLDALSPLWAGVRPASWAARSLRERLALPAFVPARPLAA
ncbi:Nitrilotriacetate monooxygenase component A [plant metagenome]|uniref:Nitrilotriacetate monooxygenase component A n=1 Tax=plant metagenome TaxID=1297885 RepID=A0A484RTR3_9ZZZZ